MIPTRRHETTYTLRSRALFVLLAGLVATLPALRAQDATLPSLTFFSYRPLSVDVTKGSATFSATAQAVDSLPGIFGVGVSWESPDGQTYVGGGMRLTSGTDLNGTWTATYTVPQYVQPGTWTIASLSIEDNLGNEQIYYASELQAMGYPTTLQVTSIQETGPPSLTLFDYKPLSVNVTKAPATFNATAQAVDSGSGVFGVGVSWQSPDGKTYVGGGMRLTSGTNLNGTWTATYTVPLYVEPGTWTIASLSIEDNIGNEQIYYASQLQAMGYPTTLQVASVQDTEPPVLSYFDYKPLVVDVTNGAATFSATAKASDNLSGVSAVGASWQSPNGETYVGGGMRLTSGTNLNGTWTATYTVPQYVEAGIWTIASMSMWDNAGNEQLYYASQLQSMGYPTTLQVIDGTPAEIKSGSNPAAHSRPVLLPLRSLPPELWWQRRLTGSLRQSPLGRFLPDSQRGPE